MRNVTFRATKRTLLPRKTIPFISKWKRCPTRIFLILPRITIPSAYFHLLFHVHIRS